MLKAQSTHDFQIQTLTKCGEIFCFNFTEFAFCCTFCQIEKFSFEDFVDHIKCLHFSQELHKSNAEDPELSDDQENNTCGSRQHLCSVDSINEYDQNELEDTKDLSNKDFSHDDKIKETTFVENSNSLKSCNSEVVEATASIQRMIYDQNELENTKDLSNKIKEITFVENRNSLKSCDSGVDDVSASIQRTIHDENKLESTKDLSNKDFSYDNKIKEITFVENSNSITSCHSKVDEVSIKESYELELENSSEKSTIQTLTHSSNKTYTREYKCTECGEVYLKKMFLDLHVRIMHNGYKCSLCDKRFLSTQKVEQHLKTHATEKKFICTIENCGRGFITQEYLKHHLEVHTKEQNFICSYENCDKAFPTRRRLLKHEYFHKTPKKNLCDVCGFTCRSRSVLVVHLRGHTGEKPFPCKVCNKPFISQSALTVHMMSHSETRAHKCSICNRAFANRSVLLLHSYVHSDERRFKCKLCERDFKHRNSLQNHMRNAHPEPKTEKLIKNMQEK